MAETNPPRPTDAEIEILKVLWRRGACTVREVFETLGEVKTTGYTTVLKTMQIMWEKGLVARDETERAHRYRAAFAEEQTQRQMVGDLLRRVFDGSAKNLVLQALSSERATASELTEIRRLLDELKGGEKP